MSIPFSPHPTRILVDDVLSVEDLQTQHDSADDAVSAVAVEHVISGWDAGHHTHPGVPLAYALVTLPGDFTFEDATLATAAGPWLSVPTEVKNTSYGTGFGTGVALALEGVVKGRATHVQAHTSVTGGMVGAFGLPAMAQYVEQENRTRIFVRHWAAYDPSDEWAQVMIIVWGER